MSALKQRSHKSERPTKEELALPLPKMHLRRKPCVLFLGGAQAGQLVPISFSAQKRWMVGRGKDCALIVDDPGISRYHAVIERGNDNLFHIMDLDSTNGTFLNNTPVLEQTLLRPGDKLQFGRYSVLNFLMQDDEEIQMMQRMVGLASRDCLTGIANRQALVDSIQREWSFAQRNTFPLSLAIFDIDHFKQINDTYGHVVGDEVLKQFVTRIQALIRREDLLARYGGEEFVLLLRNCDRGELWRLAQRLRQSIASSPFLVDGLSIQVKVSGGLSTFHPSAEVVCDPKLLIKTVDQRLYRAKSLGRNRLCST